MKLRLLMTACLIVVAANQLWTAEASPPGEVAPYPSVCVYPNKKEYRCNLNQEVSDQVDAQVRAEIMAHKQRTIDLVTAGDIDTYLTLFTDDIIFFYNDEIHRGKDELREFVERIIGGGKDLVITNVKLRVLSARHVVLVSADWELPGVSYGRYLYEDYYKQDNGGWVASTINTERLG